MSVRKNNQATMFSGNVWVEWGGGAHVRPRVNGPRNYVRAGYFVRARAPGADFTDDNRVITGFERDARRKHSLITTEVVKTDDACTKTITIRTYGVDTVECVVCVPGGVRLIESSQMTTCEVCERTLLYIADFPTIPAQRHYTIINRVRDL